MRSEHSFSSSEGVGIEKGLSFVGCITIELEIGREGDLKIADLAECLFLSHAGRDFKFAAARDANLDLMSTAPFTCR